MPKYTIFVPTVTTPGNPLPQTAVADAVQKTRNLLHAPPPQPAAGGWVSPEHGLVNESVHPVIGHSDDPDAVIAHARRLATDLGQEAVMVTQGNHAAFLAPDPQGDYPQAPHRIVLHLPPGTPDSTIASTKHAMSGWFGGFTHYADGRLVSHAGATEARVGFPRAIALARSLGAQAEVDPKD